MMTGSNGRAGAGAAALMMLAASGAAAQGGTPAATGWRAPAVNGTEASCPVVTPRPAADQARQFDTAPRDLAALSATVQKMMADTSGPGAAFRARQAEQRATDWPFLCRYRADNAALRARGERPAVVLMGDSITEGWIEADPSFFRDNNFVDRGISGQSSPQMVARFAQDVVALHPRAVHILAGTNDIGGATGPITEDEFAANINAMIDMAQANRIAVILALLPPMSMLLPRPEFDTRAMVPRLNARLRQIAATRRVALVDYYTPLASANGAFDPRYANDGVHPTRKGYAIMEPLARQVIARTLGGTPR